MSPRTRPCRLVGLLEALAVDDDEGRRVVPGPMSQARIAERLGASKAMVNRLPKDLVVLGHEHKGQVVRALEVA
jgi:CRP/FNR family cyclic AMP-dependent transcriptional regulator